MRADPLAVVLAQLPGHRRVRDGQYLAKCPAHEDKSPSLSVSEGTDGRVLVHCHGGCRFADIARAAGLQGKDFYPPSSPPPRNGHAGSRLVARPSPTLKRPPQNEVAALWEAGAPLTAKHSVCTDARTFLLARGIEPSWVLAAGDVVRVLPSSQRYAYPKWWSSSWTNTWRLAVRAYEVTGELASLHARAIHDAEPKTRWPVGFNATGLVFADNFGVAFLRCCCEGIPPNGCEAVIVVEGLTDFVATTASVERDGKLRAVLGITSGSASALGRINWPAFVPAWVATDDDRAGDAYAKEIRAALPPRVRVARVKPRKEADK